MNAPRLRHDFRKLNLSTAGLEPGTSGLGAQKKLMENKLTTVPRFVPPPPTRGWYAIPGYMYLNLVEKCNLHR